MAFDPDKFLNDEPQDSDTTTLDFDPDAFLADRPQPGRTPPVTQDSIITDFDPDAFLADRPQPTTQDNGFAARKAKTDAMRQKLGRNLTEMEMASVYEQDARARGDIERANRLRNRRLDQSVAQVNAASAEADKGPMRTLYLDARGGLGGITFGLSEPVFAAIEEANGLGRVQAETTLEGLGEGAAKLVGGVITGKGLAGGMQNLTGRLGLKGAGQVIATRLLATGAQSAVSSLGDLAANAIHGDPLDIRRAAGNVAQSLGAAIFGGVAEHAVPAGLKNWVAQVATDFVYDMATDIGLRDRLKDQSFVQWLVREELPQMIMSVAFATKDLTDANFEAQRRAVVKELLGRFKTRAFANGPQQDRVANMPEPRTAQREPAAANQAPTSRKIRDRYPLDTPESVDKAVTDLNLRPELEYLAAELTQIKNELASGDRVAGRIPIKDPQSGGIIGWTSAGKAYPEGLDADSARAIEKYLAGEALTSKQEEAVRKAVSISLENISHAAGYDIANKTTIEQERLSVGDKISIDDETFTVKSVDEDGNLILQDGRKVTAKPGEEILIDRDSHLDATGKPPDENRDPSDFDPDAFLEDRPQPGARQATSEMPNEAAPPTRQREDIGEGLYAEKRDDGTWEYVDTDGQKVPLDPSHKADYDMLIDLDPDFRQAESRRIAEETAANLPGARAHFVDNETEMDGIRAKLGRPVRDIRAENGTVRGFAVVGTPDIYLLTRNMTPGNAARTVLHEAIVHVGVRGVLGDRMDDVLQGIFQSRGERLGMIGYLAKRYGLDLNTREGQNEATEELLAHIAERRKIDPGSWGRLVARIKDAFRQMGFSWAQDWTDNDVLALIQRGKDRVSRPRSALITEAQLGIRRAMTYASGRWDDAERQQKVFEGTGRRVYEVIRQGKTIYETQARQNGQWKTVMYSDNLPEASTADYHRPGLSRETVARKILWYSIGQPWYARSIRAGLSPAEIFAPHPEIVRLIEAGEDATPAIKAEELSKIDAETGYQAQQTTDTLPLAADTGTELRYSRAVNQENETSKANDAKFRNQLEDVRQDKWNQTRTIELGETPRILRATGADPLPLVISSSVVRKVTTELHAIPWEELMKLPQAIRDPIMIFRSKSDPDALVIMTELREGNKTVVAAVHLNKLQDRHEVNSIRSLYGKESDRIFLEWVREGMLLYRNMKKSSEWSQPRGVQFPKGGAIQNSGNRILTERDIVNSSDSDIRQAKGNVAPGKRTPQQQAAHRALMRSKLYGRPDLAQMGETKPVRALGAEVDQLRNERGEPTPQTFKAWKSGADTRTQRDETGEWLSLLSGKMHFEGDAAGENTMVARKLLETKGLEAFASGSDDEIAKVAAAMWGYRNTRSNIARALAAGRDFQETPTERRRRWIAEALYYPGAKVNRKLQGMDLGQMQAELAKRAGKMQEIRQKLMDMGIDLGRLDEKTLNDNDAMAEIVRQIQISNAEKGDWAYEYWRNAILSAPTTHVANMIGNTASLAWNYTAQKGMEALINAVIRNKDGVQFTELPAMWRAMRKAQADAARNAITAFSTEMPITEGMRLDEKGLAIGGTKGKLIRTPQRILLAADEYAKTMIIQAEMYHLAYNEAYGKGWRKEALERRIQEILADPKSDMRNAAIEKAKELTFQAEPGEFALSILESRNWPWGMGWVSKFALPFVSTPTNIVLMGLRKSPIGSLAMIIKQRSGYYQGNKTAAVRDAAEQILAWAGMASIWAMANNVDENGYPRLTGSRPSLDGSAGEYQAKGRGAPSQSIRIGGRWYSYARIEPLATALSLMVDAAEAIQNRDGQDGFERITRAKNTISAMVRDKTFISGLGDIIRVFTADQNADKVLTNFLASWNPNIIRSWTRATDPYIRDNKLRQRDDRGMLREYAASVGRAAVPAGGLQTPPRIDYWGRPIVKQEGFAPITDVVWRMFSPIQVQTVKTPENFDRLLFNYNRKARDNGWKEYFPAMPGNTFQMDGIRGDNRKAYMNPDEYATFLTRRADAFMKEAAKGKYKWNFENPTKNDIHQLEFLMEKAGNAARKPLRETHQAPPSFSSYQRDLDAEQARKVIDRNAEMARKIFGR